MDTPENLRLLSELATPGPWQPENSHKISPRTTICYLYFEEGFNSVTESFNECLSVASGRGLQDAEFIAELVNWFRAKKVST